MTLKEFELILKKTKRQNQESMKRIEEHSRAFDRKYKEILLFL